MIICMIAAGEQNVSGCACYPHQPLLWQRTSTSNDLPCFSLNDLVRSTTARTASQRTQGPTNIGRFTKTCSQCGWSPCSARLCDEKLYLRKLKGVATRSLRVPRK